MSDNTKLYTWLSKILGICFALFMVCMLISNLYENKASITMILGFGTIFLFVLFTLYLIYQKIEWKGRMHDLCIWGVLGVLFVIQVIIAIAACTSYGWDVGMVVDSAIQLADSGTLSNPSYFAYYPNNVFLLLFYTNLFRIVKILGNPISYLMAAIICNIILVDISIIMLYLCGKKLLGEKRGILPSLFAVPMIGLNPWFLIPYTDTFALSFPIIIYYIYLKFIKNEWKGIPSWFFIGITASVGILVKPQTIIILIAIVLVEIFSNHLKKETIIKGITYSLSLLIGFLLISNIFHIYSNYETSAFISEELKYEREVPFTHFFMMGMNEETLGSWYTPDVDATQSIIGKDEKMKFNLQVIKQRYQDFGVTGYLSFLSKKAVNIYKDGSFGYGLEGSFNTSDPFRQGKIYEKIQDVMLYNREGYEIYKQLLNAYWVVLLAFFVISVKNIWRTEEKFIDVMKLAIFGLTLFLLLFEGRARYLYHLLPIFILVASDGFLSWNYKRKRW